MKRIFLALLGIVSFQHVYALPVYNPSEPTILYRSFFDGCIRDQVITVDLGYRGDRVFNRKMKFKNVENISSFNKNLSDFRIFTDGVQLTFDICRKVGAYAWIGDSFAFVNTKVNAFMPDGTLSGLQNSRMETRDGYSFGFGVKAILWRCRKAALGADLQYSHFRGNTEYLNNNGIPIASNTGGPINRMQDFYLKYQEYQASLGFSYQVYPFLIPYMAVKYSRVKSQFVSPLIQDTILYRMNFRSCIPFGVALGVTFLDGGSIQVTGEGRFVDETAATLAASIKF